jgi:hypothetical protein
MKGSKLKFRHEKIALFSMKLLPILHLGEEIYQSQSKARKMKSSGISVTSVACRSLQISLQATSSAGI